MSRGPAGRTTPGRTTAGPRTAHVTAAVALALTLVVLTLAAALGLAPAAGATPAPEGTASPSPSPSPVAVADGVPADVVEWFTTQTGPVVATEGAGELDELTAEERGQVVPGTVRPVMGWAPGVLDGTDLEPPALATRQWVAPLLLGEEPVGSLFVAADPDGAGPVLDHIDASADLAAALAELDPAASLVYDAPLDAWFAVSDAVVRPVGEAAGEVLAGAVALETYQPFLAERYAAGDDPAQDHAPPEEGGGWGPVAVVAAVLVLVLAWAALVVWLRRPDPAAGEPAPDPTRHPRDPRVRR